MVHTAAALALAVCLAVVHVNAVGVLYPGRSYQADESGQYSDSQLSHTAAAIQERGTLHRKADGDYVLFKEGSYKYISPEGVPVEIKYYADDTGFHPTGNAIPVAPQPVQPVF